ncbi:MAG TPA: aminopeptidase, partial [Mycobacterium sp.]|nr:aminopeptidase [Mycobacterium sp.]
MTTRRLIIGVGAVLLLAGIIGLLTPVSVSDSNGHSVGC